MRDKNSKQSLKHVALMGVFGAAVIVASGSRAFGESPSGCKREKFHQAVQACHTETGVAKPEKGRPPANPPSEEDRKKMDECLKTKGFTKPPHPPGPHGEGRPPGPPPPLPSED